MTPHAGTQSLIEILNRLFKQLSSLHGLLQREEKALAENQYATIEHIASQKTELTHQVEVTEQFRLDLCLQLEIQPDFNGIQSYSKQFHASAGNTILTQWQNIADLGQQCATQNQINGLLVAHQQRRTREALAVLRGNVSSDDRYSHSGIHESSQNQHSLGKV